MTDTAEISGAIERVKRGTRNKDMLLICDELASRLKTKPVKAPKNGDWPQWKDTERKKLWGKLTQAVRRARRGLAQDTAEFKRARTPDQKETAESNVQISTTRVMAAEKALKKEFPDAALLKG